MREVIVYQDNNGAWVAECKELPGYRVRGNTREEALDKIRATLLKYYPFTCEE